MTAIGTLAAVLIFSSLTNWQWRLWLHSRHILLEGTRREDDLSPYLTDRLVAAFNAEVGLLPQIYDLKAEEEIAFVSNRASRVLAIDGQDPSPGSRVVTLVLVALGLLGVSAAGVCLGSLSARRIAARRYPPVLLDTLQERASQSALSAMYAIVIIAPLASVLVWYASFDRNFTRTWIGEFFSPNAVEWCYIYILVLVFTFIVASRLWSRSIVSNMGVYDRLKFRLCRKGSYQLAGIRGEVCPECGLAESSKRVKRGGSLILSYLIGFGIVALAISAVLVVERRGWMNEVWHWVILRCRFMPDRIEGYLPLGQVAEIEWADERGWLFVGRVVRTNPALDDGQPHSIVVWGWRATSSREAEALQVLAFAPEKSSGSALPNGAALEFGKWHVYSNFSTFVWNVPVTKFGIEGPICRFRIGENMFGKEDAGLIQRRCQELLRDGAWKLLE